MKRITWILFLATTGLCTAHNLRYNLPKIYHPASPGRRNSNKVNTLITKKQTDIKKIDITEDILQNGQNTLIDLSRYFVDENNIKSENGPFLQLETIASIRPFVYQLKGKSVEFFVDNNRLLNYFHEEDKANRELIDHVDPADKKMTEDVAKAISHSLLGDVAFGNKLRSHLMTRLSIPGQSKMMLDQNDLTKTFGNAYGVKKIARQVLGKLL